MNKSFIPSWNLVGPSLELIRENSLGFMYLILLPSLLTTLGLLLSGYHGGDHLYHGWRLSAGLAISGLGIAWTAVNLGPTTYFELQAVHGKSDSLRNYYRYGLRYTLPLIGLYILTGLIVLAGFILFIVPGLFMLRRYILAPYYMVDQKLSIIEALKRSAQDSKPAAGAIWGIIGVQLAIVLGSGIFSVIPVAGVILEQLVAYAATFLYALRYYNVIQVLHPEPAVRSGKAKKTRRPAPKNKSKK